MWELDNEKGWVPKNWFFWAVVLEKTLESPLDSKKIQPVHPKGDQSLNIPWKDWGWIWSSSTLATWWKSWLIWKDPDAGKEWRQEEKGTTEDEMVWWHHRLNDTSLSKLWGMVKDREAWRAAVHGVTKSWTHLSDWKTMNKWEPPVEHREPYSVLYGDLNDPNGKET